MKSILDRVTVGMTERMAVADADEEIHKQVQKTVILARATQVCVDLHVTYWVTTQQDSILKTVIEWMSGQKVQDLKHLLGKNTVTEAGRIISESKGS